jgi:hypothetical protein
MEPIPLLLGLNIGLLYQHWRIDDDHENDDDEFGAIN